MLIFTFIFPFWLEIYKCIYMFLVIPQEYIKQLNLFSSVDHHMDGAPMVNTKSVDWYVVCN